MSTPPPSDARAPTRPPGSRIDPSRRPDTPPWRRVAWLVAVTAVLLGVNYSAASRATQPPRVRLPCRPFFPRPAGTRVTFADVAGIDEAKAELTEIVEFLKKTDKYRRLGGRIPRGVLLSGPPATGKTLLARAVAGEADVPFFSMSASEFVEAIV